MVGVLREPGEAPALAPQPGLAQLAGLVEQVREAGLDVELRVDGEPAQLPAGIDLAAYRVVQEGLTNVLKHTGAERAEVVLRYEAGALDVLVSDDGRGIPPGTDGGHGLIGLRERVSVYGGRLWSGPEDGAGFRLRARLPLGEASASAS